MANKPDDLLRSWNTRVPKEGAPCSDAIAVMRLLGMEVERRPSGHLTGAHPRLVGSARFPQGIVTINCHAFGKHGVVHPEAIRDIVRAARIISEDQDAD